MDSKPERRTIHLSEPRQGVLLHLLSKGASEARDVISSVGGRWGTELNSIQALADAGFVEASEKGPITPKTIVDLTKEGRRQAVATYQAVQANENAARTPAAV